MDPPPSEVIVIVLGPLTLTSSEYAPPPLFFIGVAARFWLPTMVTERLAVALEHVAEIVTGVIPPTDLVVVIDTILITSPVADGAAALEEVGVTGGEGAAAGGGTVNGGQVLVIAGAAAGPAQGVNCPTTGTTLPTAG